MLTAAESLDFGDGVALFLLGWWLIATLIWLAINCAFTLLGITLARRKNRNSNPLEQNASTTKIYGLTAVAPLLILSGGWYVSANTLVLLLPLLFISAYMGYSMTIAE